MKRFALLVAALFLFGCGGGGGTTAGGTASGTGGGASPSGGTISAQVVKFTIKLEDGTSKTGKVVAASVLPTPDAARVVMRQYGEVVPPPVPVYNYDENGDPILPAIGFYQPPSVFKEVYKRVVDTVINSDGSISFACPVGDKYTIDVLTYTKDTTKTPNINTMLKFGRITEFNVTPTTTSTGIIINDVMADATTAPTLGQSKSLYIQLPVSPSPNPNNVSAVKSEQTYTIKATTKMPLRYLYNARQDLARASSLSYDTFNLIGQSGSALSITAPTSSDPTKTTLYFSAKFFIDDSMLNAGESYLYWIRTYPNTATGYDETLQCSFDYLVILGS